MGVGVAGAPPRSGDCERMCWIMFAKSIDVAARAPGDCEREGELGRRPPPPSGVVAARRDAALERAAGERAPTLERAGERGPTLAERCFGTGGLGTTAENSGSW